MKIEIEKIFITSELSSGSGLAIADDMIWMVGDDVGYVVKSTVGDTDFCRIKLYENASEKRMEKPEKHDLEACIIGKIDQEQLLFVFGSGGISPHREMVFALNLENTDKRFKWSTKTLYSAIRNKKGLKENELNIEGAALAGDKLVLFNRGKNFIILMKWNQFVEYLLQEDAHNLPPFNIIDVELPVVNDIQIGFSGACAINENELLFTSSREETNDFITDGAIRGSYIGILKLESETTVKLVTLTPFINKNGETIIDKLEAIEALNISGNKISAIAVADNDDGTSKLFYLTINRP